MKKLLLLFTILLGFMAFSQSHVAIEEPDAFSGGIASVISESGDYRLTADKRGQVILSIYDGFDFSKVGVVLDIRDEVANFGELGLTSIVLDPDFETNFKYYLYYPVEREDLGFTDGLSLPTIARVTAYTLDISQNQSYDRDVILGTTLQNGIPVTDNNHFGGTLLFGNDGSLLLSTGETGVGSTAQAVIDGIMREAERTRFRALLLNGANGKVLRFDKETGLGLSDNPFYDEDNPDIPKSKVWAKGLRNPFRMSIDKNSEGVGDLYIADVGAGNWEEINICNKPALNFGWRIFESFDQLNQSDQINLDTGNTFFSEYIEPTSFEDSEDLDIRSHTHKYPSIAYSHFSDEDKILLPSFVNGVMTPIEKEDFYFEGLSVIVGSKIQGQNFGEDYEGGLLFSDIFTNSLVIAKNADFNQLEVVIESDLLTNVVHWEQHPNGQVYATTLGGKIVKVFYDETLSVSETVIKETLLDVKYTSLLGVEFNDSQGLKDGLYFAKYLYKNRVDVKKIIIKNGEIITR